MRRGVRRIGGGGSQPCMCNTSRYRYYTITKLVVLFKVIDTYIVFMCAVYVLCNRAVGRFQNRGVGNLIYPPVGIGLTDLPIWGGTVF